MNAAPRPTAAAPSRDQLLALSALRILQNHRHDGDTLQQERTQELIVLTFGVAACSRRESHHGGAA